MGLIRRALAAGVAVACLSGAARGQDRLVRTAGWRHLFEAGPIDPGIGALAFAQGAWDAGARRDTIPLFERPGAAQPSGYVVFASDSVSVGPYAVAWPVPLVTNLIEVGYEIAGLPIDSLTGSGWARAIVGFEAGDRPVRAWVPVDEGSVEQILWSEHLPAQDLFFRSGVTPAFFDAPDGRAAAFALPAGSDDYVLHPLEARDGWLRVRAVTPSDMCADPEGPSSAELWIRYLDRAGRPRVWYHTRGC